jgi:MinD-like ATPase involved in chromosome partitioning or flagellar assembly
VSLVAVIGNASTTTALAIASSWPHGEEALLAELDPSGGDLAAWLDLSQEPGIASAVSAAPSGAWPSIAEHIQTQAGGLQLLVAPIRALEAAAAVREASARLVPTLSALDEPVVIADCGRQNASQLAPIVTQAGLVIVTVRQRRMSERSAAAELDRAAELIDALTARNVSVVGIIIGDEPYPFNEVAAYLAGDLAVPMLPMAEDPIVAAILAGRPSSDRRLRKSRLLETAVPAAAEIALRLRAARAVPSGIGR